MTLEWGSYRIRFSLDQSTYKYFKGVFSEIKVDQSFLKVPLPITIQVGHQACKRVVIGQIKITSMQVMYRSLGLFKNTRPLYFLSWSIDLGKIDPIKLSKCTHAYSQHLCCSSVNYRVCGELPWGHFWIGIKLMNFFSAARCSMVLLLIAVVLWELASSLWKYWYFLLIVFFF